MVIPTTNTTQDGEEDIWGSVLQAYRRGASSAEKGTLLVLGDVNSGKSALFARARGEQIPPLKPGVALSYDFMSVYEDHTEEPTGDIDVWILEGETHHRDLLRASLTEESVANGLAVICLDFMQPWLIEESLDKWLDFLRKMLAEVRSESIDKRPEEQLVHYLQNYSEPAEDAASKTRKKKRATIVITDDLGENTDDLLKFNLGIPIVVVCCKSDTAMLLEKDYDIKTPFFEYIQLRLRQTCLNYGASLVFTSAKKDINTELLMDYIEHRLFGMEFHYRANLLENDSIFVPAGWDSSEKIQTDAKTLHVDLSQPFESVVKRPPHAKRSVPVPVITAEDDVAFMTKHKIVIDQEDSELESLRGGSWRTPTTPALSLLTPSTATTSAFPTIPSSATRMSATEDLSHTPVISTTKARPADSFVTPSAKDKHVLATFFDALLKSKDAKRTDPSSPLGRGIPQARHDVEKELERLKNAMKK